MNILWHLNGGKIFMVKFVDLPNEKTYSFVLFTC
jgi:hypothetical protein